MIGINEFTISDVFLKKNYFILVRGSMSGGERQREREKERERERERERENLKQAPCSVQS